MKAQIYFLLENNLLFNFQTVCCSGKTHKEHWTRKICEDGFYRCCKVEGLEEFMKAQNMPESLCKAMADMTISWKNCGTGFQMMKCFGGMKAKTCAKFDEEFCEKGQCGMPDSKCVVTKSKKY